MAALAATSPHPSFGPVKVCCHWFSFIVVTLAVSGEKSVHGARGGFGTRGGWTAALSAVHGMRPGLKASRSQHVQLSPSEGTKPAGKEGSLAHERTDAEQDSARSQPSQNSTQDAVKAKNKEDDGDPVHDFVVWLGSWAESGMTKGSKMSDTYQVKMNAEGDTEALISAFIFSFVMFVITVCIFTALRAYMPKIYAARENSCADGDTGSTDALESSPGAFSWIRAAWNVSNDEVVQKAGLDGLMLLEFCRLFQDLMLTLSPLVICMLCPVHMLAVTTDNKELLCRLGICAVLHGHHIWPGIFCIHAGMVWVVVLTTMYFVYQTNEIFLKHRFEWLTRIPEPRSTTLMVEGIPPEFCSDDKLKNHFVHLFDSNAIQGAYVVRKTSPLRQKLVQLESTKSRLAKVQRQWERSGRDEAKIPRIGVGWAFWKTRSLGQSAIEFYSNQVKQLRDEIKQERIRIEEGVAMTPPDAQICSTAGFVTFTSQRACRLASREQFRTDTRQFVVSMPPDPIDVVYEDLAKDPAKQERGNLLAVFWVCVLVIFWTPLVASTTTLTSFSNLKETFPSLGYFIERHAFLNTLLQGLMASFALKFLMGWLPSILMIIIRQFLTLKSGRWAQLKLQNRYFIFQITFVVFVVTLSQGIVRTFEDIRHHPQSIVKILATSLPEASHFYLNYVLLGAFTVAIELLRWFQCASYLIYTRAYTMNPEEAKALVEPEDQDGQGTGARFAKVGLIMTLSIVFSTVMPFITLFGFFYFAIARTVFAYLLVFAETQKPDLGGAFWILTIKHIIFALVLFVTLMLGILNLHRRGVYPAVAISPTFLVIFLFWQRIGEFNWQILPFEQLADLEHKEEEMKKSSAGGVESVVHQRYCQPEMKDGDTEQG